jgi:hypothetical protein
MTTRTKADLLSLAVFPVILFCAVAAFVGAVCWLNGSPWRLLVMLPLMFCLAFTYFRAIFNLRDRQAIEEIISRR